jgi:DNA-binding response OmpR family regulator
VNRATWLARRAGSQQARPINPTGAAMQIGVDSQRAVENKRVFIIDSDDISSTALQFMLADECEAHVLPNVVAALDKAVEWPPQLVLLGAGVLAMEGVGAVTRFKARIDNVKVMIVCDSAADPLVKEALTLGANSTLPRPLKLETVRQKVNVLLGRRALLDIAVAAL